MQYTKNTKEKYDWSSIDLFYALKMSEKGGVLPRRILDIWKANEDAPRGCYGIGEFDLSKAGFWQKDNADYALRNPVCNLSGFGYGFEIEVEISGGHGRSTVVESVSKRFNKLMLCKRDGSLSCGTEVVTPVFSADILNAKSLEIQAMTDLFELLSSFNCKVPSSTGGHIHFSDPRLVNKTKDFCLFVESILQDTDEFAIKAIFGRNIDSTSYATAIKSELKGVNGNNFGRFKKVREAFGRNEVLDDRYMFIHAVDDNSGHIEFRLPAGTLNIMKLVARIHFLNACVCEFAKYQNRDWLEMGGVFKRILNQIYKKVKGFKKYYALRMNELSQEES